jgi:two-component system, sensor histidine kinase and response regulator
LAAILVALGKTAPPQPQKKPTADPLPEEAGRLCILLAEDNRVNLTLATRLLEKRGHTVVAVENGREAVAAFEQQALDLALLDVQMPVMDGLQAVGLIRKIESDTGSGNLPIIALTAHSMVGDEERCLAAGMDAYVSKPIKAKRLFKVIEELASCAMVVE